MPAEGNERIVKAITDAAGDIVAAVGTVAVPADGPAGTPSMRTLGTGATQAAAGNDARLTDERTPSNLSVTTGKIADGAVTAAKVGPDVATQAELDAVAAAKAPLASPALTGTPTAPTPASGTNTTQIATAAFVKTAIDNLVNGAPGALDTLKEIADQLAADESAAAALTALVALKAPLASPALTGTPTAPTPASGTNTTQIATAAFVGTAVSALAATTATRAELPIPRPSSAQAYDGISVPAGVAIVALRFDDSDAAVRDTVLPLLTARGIPAGFAPSMGVLGQSTNLTNADLLSMQRQGMDVMVQWDEATLSTDAAFREHSMDLADSLEAAQPGLRLDTFTESGVWDSATKAAYGGQSDTFLESAIGREFRRRFLCSLGYAKDDIGTTFVRPVPAIRRWGANHATLDGVSTLSGWQAPVLKAEAMGGAIEILSHPRNLGLGGQLSVANFTSWLDWLVAERDAGRIVLLTPTAALHARQGTRPNLLGVGTLEAWAADSTTSPFTGTATASADGTGRGGTGKAATTSTSAQLSLSIMGSQSLRTLEIGGWAKAVSGTATARLLVRSYNGATQLQSVNVTPTVTDTGWTNVRRVIGCDPNVTSVTVSWYAQSGSVLWDDIAVHKA